jgi:hypothetical protein
MAKSQYQRSESKIMAKMKIMAAKYQLMKNNEMTATQIISNENEMKIMKAENEMANGEISANIMAKSQRNINIISEKIKAYQQIQLASANSGSSGANQRCQWRHISITHGESVASVSVSKEKWHQESSM